MLHINALRLEINTVNGLYQASLFFEAGLNIIRANNTSGKSTLFQSILYALGFEELIGGRNEKTMQSVLRDSVKHDGKEYAVLQSAVVMEIFNGKETVTVRRSVLDEKRKPQLVDVIYGAQLSNPGSYDVRHMYLHDRGAAKDETYGFHVFLEEFLGWQLPQVYDTSGNSTKLYLPLIAPSFIIEQKSGWSSFFATMPYYGVKDAEERVVEFLLRLDVFQNEQAKVSLGIERRSLTEKWTNLYLEFMKEAHRNSGTLVGLPETPTIINNLSEVYFRILREDKHYLIHELIDKLQVEYEEIARETEITVGANVAKNQSRLEEMNTNLARYSHLLSQLENDNVMEKDQLKQYILQRRTVEEDLENNKSAKKMLDLGAETSLSVADSKCPTCGQDINGTLLPPEVDQSPMDIENNIDFLTSQLRMLEVFIGGQRRKVSENETRITAVRNYLSQLRQDIRSIKRDLVSDERLPSEELIERKINLRRLIKVYENSMQTIEDLKSRLRILITEWEAIKRAESALTGNFITASDKAKLDYLQARFLTLLRSFNYSSKDSDSIRISTDKYVPVIEIKLPNERSKFYDIRFDSSGSDHIRTLWAYYVALMETSIVKSGNHPNLLIFDEPQQQSSSTKDFHEFLTELSSIKIGQSIVFASFQNSQSDFNSATKDLVFHKIEGKGMFVVPA